MKVNDHRSAELSVTWEEFSVLTAAPDDGTGAALLDVARGFLAAGELAELVGLHRAGVAINVRAQQEVRGRRLVRSA